MSDLQVRIVELAPMHVVEAYGFGSSPELAAWGTLLAWVKAAGLMEDLTGRRFFGFNDPNPSHGSPNYGYRQWMTLQDDVEVGGDLQARSFEGGFYAVTRCHGVHVIGDVWQRLVLWCEENGYPMAHHQWLEECFTPLEREPSRMVFDLYLPIRR